MSRHPLPPPWSRPPSSLSCFSPEASRLTTMLHPHPSVYTQQAAGSSHTSCHSLQWLPSHQEKSLPTASQGPACHFLPKPVTLHLQLLFAGSTLASSPWLFPLPLGLCTSFSLILESLRPVSCLHPPFTSCKSFLFCEAFFVPSIWHRNVCPLYLTLQSSVTSHSSLLLNFSPEHL